MKKIYSMMLIVTTLGVFLSGCLLESTKPISTREKKPVDPKISAITEFSQSANMDERETIVAEVEGVDLAYYTNYSTSKFDTLKGKKKFVVFFFSDWCGTCRVWEAKVKAAGNRLPTNTVILKASYDNDKDLVKALGVKTQSTAVFFGADGEILDIVIDPSLEALITFFSS